MRDRGQVPTGMGRHGGLFTRNNGERCEVRDWNGIGRCFLDGFLAVNAVGRSRGVVVAWNEAVFSRVDAWTGQFSAVVKLKR